MSGGSIASWYAPSNKLSFLRLDPLASKYSWIISGVKSPMSLLLIQIYVSSLKNRTGRTTDGVVDFFFLPEAADFVLAPFGFLLRMLAGKMSSSSTIAGHAGYPFTLANTTVVGGYFCIMDSVASSRVDGVSLISDLSTGEDSSSDILARKVVFGKVWIDISRWLFVCSPRIFHSRRVTDHCHCH